MSFIYVQHLFFISINILQKFIVQVYFKPLHFKNDDFFYNFQGTIDSL